MLEQSLCLACGASSAFISYSERSSIADGRKVHNQTMCAVVCQYFSPKGWTCKPNTITWRAVSSLEGQILPWKPGPRYCLQMLFSAETLKQMSAFVKVAQLRVSHDEIGWSNTLICHEEQPFEGEFLEFFMMCFPFPYCSKSTPSPSPPKLD